MKLAVYGLGKLGYPLANVFARSGFHVVGIDPVHHDEVPWETIEPEVCWPEGSLERFSYSSAPQPAAMSFIIVPTPSLTKGDRRGGFDSSYVEGALRQIRKVNEEGHIAVIISTLSPGTCEEILDMPEVSGGRLKVVYNPTFIAIGQVIRNLVRPDMLLLGSREEDERETKKVKEVWFQVFDELGGMNHPFVHHGSLTEIELIKLSFNCALATRISLGNSLGRLFEAYGVNPAAVSVLSHDHRIGIGYITPGSPIAGPCLPRDNQALQMAAIKKNLHLPLSVATEKVNHELIESFYDRICGRDSDHVGHRPASVGILGTSYKYGTDITTASAGERIAQRLEAAGVHSVSYDDILQKDTLDQVLDCQVVVVTQKEYDPLVTNHIGKVVRIWP